MSKNFTFVSIEGNIGSGKSTLLKYLKQKFSENSKYIFINEPVQVWENIIDESGENIIQKFYSNPEKYSFPFQMIAYSSRLSSISNAIKQANESQLEHVVIVSERSLETDRYVFAEMLYKQGKIEPICYQIYLHVFNQFKEIYTPDVVIYIKVFSGICYGRVHERRRIGEEVISLNYLISCGEQHDYFINEVLTNCVKLTLCGNINIYEEENKNVLNQWGEMIETTIETAIRK